MKKPILALFILAALFLSMRLEVKDRGVADKTELSEILFNAIKMNNFEMLSNYIPSDNEIEYLKNHANKKNKYLYESLNAAELRMNTKINFDKLIEGGIKKEINWSTTELIDSKIEEDNSSKKIYKGIFSVQDSKSKSIRISFDIIKIKNNWFLFQGIRVDK